MLGQEVGKGFKKRVESRKELWQIRYIYNDLTKFAAFIFLPMLGQIKV